MSFPPYAVTFRGLPACPCLATWVPAYEAELQRRGLLTGPIRIYQLIGGAAASGGTHALGGAYDTQWIGDAAIWVARQMGADATWHRPHNWDGAGGMEHVHGVLTNCPHNGPAHYQIDAVKAGYNGLGHLGHGAPDTGPRPLSGRTWQQGLAWARTQRQTGHTDMALLADLEAARKKHGVTRVYAARVLLRAALDVAGTWRATRLRTVIAAMKGL